jgi:phosphohistidine phosphatase
MGLAMRKAGLAPDVVLVSPSLRTQQTFDILEAVAVWDERPNIDTLPALYMASSHQIRDILRGLPETVRSALVVGHNPGLHELAHSLAGPAHPQPDLARLSRSFPTASLAEFLVAAPWRRLGPGTTSLQRYLQPADFI